MSAEDIINDEFMVLEEETMKVAEEVAAYQRKLMVPIWEKRSHMIKKIPNFWSTAIGNSPLLAVDPSENDIEAVESLTDLQVEYDEKRPNYRKVTATFGKNNVFKNATLVKEFSIDPEDDGNVISKTTIEYHEDKAPKKAKRKSPGDDDDDELDLSVIEWFGDDDVRLGIIITEDVFPNAIDFFQGPGEFDEEDEEDIELGSEDESDEDIEVPQKKKSKK